MHVVAEGNPFDGIDLYGPFETTEDASTWAENNCGEWWITEVEPPRQ